MKIKTIFIASDGTEFTTEKECHDYEQAIEATEKKEAERLNDLEILNAKFQAILKVYDEAIAELETEMEAYEDKYEGHELDFNLQDEIVDTFIGFDAPNDFINCLHNWCDLGCEFYDSFF